MQTHCVFYNINSAKEFLKLYNRISSVDTFQLFNNTFKCYSLTPNNIFFQLSDKKHIYETSGYKYMVPFIYLQSLFTSRLYYQYDPKFVKYWEPYGFTYYTFLIFIKFILLIIYISSILIKKYI